MVETRGYQLVKPVEYDYLLDPHTACGVGSYYKLKNQPDMKCICLATAHPAKFDEAITACNITQQLPKEMELLYGKSQKMDIIDNSTEEVLSYIEKSFGDNC